MTHDRASLDTRRQLPYPPDAVYAAFAAPERLARWWGPDGFANTFERFDFAPGGAWVFTMHGPDGTELRWRQTFADAATADALRAVCEPANEQNLDRLHAELAAGGPADGR